MREITYRDALNEALHEEMARDPSVLVLGEEVALYEGAYKVTRGLLARFGERRVKDTPIAEEVIAGSAIGAAMGGLRPVAEMMTWNFAILAFDQIINHAAKIRYMFGGRVKLPLVIRGPQGGGKQLAAQHSQSVETWLAHCPGLKVVCPSSPADAKGLLVTAIRDDDPVMFLEHEILYNAKGNVPEGEIAVPFGQAAIVHQGSDVTIITYSLMTLKALKAAEELERDGIHAEVIDLRTLVPLDMEAVLASVRKTNRALVVQEGWPVCGMASEIAARIQEDAFDDLDAPVRRLTGKPVPMPYNRILEAQAVPQVPDIVAEVRRLAA
ncbi:MAG: alpha-ketoacid dehydrogenase subunit beta [Gemmatimonadetes bacterium]|nr:alpha-ketoacid dehydrogenase subunit beta [Gemmatimonadota bacterium]